MYKGERGPISPLERVPFEVNQWIQNRVSKYHIEWAMAKQGTPKEPGDPNMPSWRDFAAIRRDEIKNEVLRDPRVSEYMGDPNLDWPEREIRGKQVIEAINYEIETGVIEKFENPEAKRTA